MGAFCYRLYLEDHLLSIASPTSEVATIFSTAVFSQTWASFYNFKVQLLGTKHDLGALYTETSRLHLRNFLLSPAGLYWGSDIVDCGLERAFAELILKICNRWNCLSLSCSFRYDSRDQLDYVLKKLKDTDYKISTTYTHIIPIAQQSYADIIHRRVKPVTRQQIRYGTTYDLQIKKITTPLDLEKHYKLYLSWAMRKSLNPVPSRLFSGLICNPSLPATLWGAFRDEVLHAAILVFRGKNEWFYWHSVRNPDVDKHFATDFLLAYALEEACKNGARYFNLGGSQNIKSLEFFKERWGGEKRPVWHLAWKSAFWQSALPVLKGLSNHLRGNQGGDHAR